MAKEFPVTIYFVQKTGLVLAGVTYFPEKTGKAGIIKWIKELIDEGGSPTHKLDFLSTYPNVMETVSVQFFSSKISGQFNYQRGDLK